MKPSCGGWGKLLGLWRGVQGSRQTTGVRKEQSALRVSRSRQQGWGHLSQTGGVCLSQGAAVHLSILIPGTPDMDEAVMGRGVVFKQLYCDLITSHTICCSN